MNKSSSRFREFIAVDGLTVFGILALTLFVVILAAILVLTDRNTASEAQQKYDAISAGIGHAKRECTADKISHDICSQITAEASKSSCEGATCWMVYAHSDKSEYVATMTVQQIGKGRQFTITNYHRGQDSFQQ